MIEIRFDNSCKEAYAFGLTQWDKGQKLKIIWEDMPDKIQVHFSSRGTDEAVVTDAVTADGEAVVDIPDVLLKNCADILVWLYLSENVNVGESIKKGVLYVRQRAKPHTAVDDVEISQQEVLENILSDINENIRDIKVNGTDSEYFPEYVKKQAEDVAQKVLSCCNEDSVVFIAASDAHCKNGDFNSETAIRHMSQAMRLIAESCPVDFAVYLGDMTSGGSDKDITDALSEMMKVNSALHKANCNLPSFRCAGSEDSLNKAYYRNGTFIDSVKLYNIIGKWNRDVTRPENDKIRGYFYKDFDDEKLRVICLNTSDTYGKKLLPSTQTANMSMTQLNWLCKSLDLSDKADNSEWRIILLSHHPLDMKGRFAIAQQLLEAYVNGTSINILNSLDERLIYDFTGKNAAVILGHFHGHLHNYRVRFITSKNIPAVTIPNAGYYDNNFYADSSYTNAENDAYGEEKTYNKTINSALDTAFCVIVLDKSTGSINAIHYGAGIDRSITGTDIWEDSGTDSGNDGNNENGSGSNEPGGDNGESGGNGEVTYVYNNLVTMSETKAGNQYSGRGYMNDYSLSSLDEISYRTGYTHTGYISATSKDVIRIAGADVDGSSGNSILVFDKNHEVIWIASLAGEKDIKSGIEYTTTGVLVFTPSKVQTGTLTDMSYIRISVKGNGENLIVTKNEEIDGSEISEDIGSPVVSYTNIVQYATDKYGNEYGDGGSINNCRLTGTGEPETATGFVCIGYLEADTEAVIRVKGIGFDGTEGSYLCVYDNNHSLIKAIKLNGKNDTDNAVVYEGAVMKFTPGDAVNNYSSIAYFRVSGIGTNSNLVVTYCEEIS